MTEQLTWKPIKVALGDLIPNPNNPKSSDEETVERLRDSIDTLGQFETLAVDSDGVSAVDGHQRLNAWIDALGADYVVDAMQASRPLTEEEKRKIILYSGKGTHGQWDFEMLGDLFSEDELTDWGGFDADQFDFGSGESSGGNTDEDAVPDTPKDPVTVLGDIWLMGDHRLMCGSSIDADSVAVLLNGNKPNTMVTDPPYGVELDQSWRDAALGEKAMGKGNSNVVENDDRADWSDAWELFDGNIAYVWHASSFTDVVMQSLRNAGFEPKQQIIWNKSVMVMGRSDYHFKHEPCWYAIRKGKNHNWRGDRKQTTIWDAAPPNHIMGGSDEVKTAHPTQKPAILFEIAYGNNTNPGEYVYEPFGGSGVSIVVCEKMGRRSLTMELEPKYCDVIVNRWEQYSGKSATLESSGKTFAEVKAERS